MNATINRPPTASFAPENDQGLPLVALRADEIHHLDWEPLIDLGVVPSLALGAERRANGPR